jgi:hypothetical protein
MQFFIGVLSDGVDQFTTIIRPGNEAAEICDRLN